MTRPAHTIRPSTDQLIADAQQAAAALRCYIDSVMPDADKRHGIALDTADECVGEVEAFVKAYRKLYGSPVR